MLVTLHHYTRGHTLKQIFSKHRLRLGWSELSNAGLTIVNTRHLVLNELSFARFHAVEDHDADVMLGSHPLECHYKLSNRLTSLTEALITAAFQELAEGVHDDQLEFWLGLDQVLKLVPEQILIAVIQNPQIGHSLQYLVLIELIEMPFVDLRVAIKALHDLAPECLSHLSHSVSLEVIVRVDV